MAGCLTILLAPDSFKGSLSSDLAALAMAEGVSAGWPQAEPRLCPAADGGEGTARIVARTEGGHPTRVPAHNPLGRPMAGQLYELAHDTVIFDMATVGGYTLVKPGERDVLRSTTHGCGELLDFARRHGARRVIMGLGGSVTVDAGLGALEALGVRFLDARGRRVQASPRNFRRIARIDTSCVDPGWLQLDLCLLYDTRNRLLGPNGAARLFAPFKGATPAEVDYLEDALTRWARVLSDHCGHDVAAMEGGSGSGGMGLALHAVLGGRMVRGVDYVLDRIGFDNALAGSQLVLTGEGRLDATTLFGKLPMAVAERAGARGISTWALAGEISLDPAQIRAAHLCSAMSIMRGPMTRQHAMAHARDLLARAAAGLGSALAAGYALGAHVPGAVARPSAVAR